MCVWERRRGEGEKGEKEGRKEKKEGGRKEREKRKERRKEGKEEKRVRGGGRGDNAFCPNLHLPLVYICQTRIFVSE